MALDADDSWAIHACGKAHQALDNLEQTVEDYQQARSLDSALTMDDSAAIAYYERGAILLEAGSEAKAIELFSVSAEINAYDHQVFSYSGHAYASQRDFEAAMGDFGTVMTVYSALFVRDADLAIVFVGQHPTGQTSVGVGQL